MNKRQYEGLPEFDDNIIDGMMKYIKNDSIMLEYGSGGSTLYFPKFVKKFYSIEFVTEFYKKIQSELEEKFNYNNVYCYCVEPTQFRGTEPLSVRECDITNKQYKKLKEKYPHHTEHSIKRYWQFRDHVDFIDTIGLEKIDVALIDGRARGMCATKVAEYMDGTGIIFMDDFFGRSNEYFGPTEKEDFLKMFDLVETLYRNDSIGRGTGQMAVFRKKV